MPDRDWTSPEGKAELWKLLAGATGGRWFMGRHVPTDCVSTTFEDHRSMCIVVLPEILPTAPTGEFHRRRCDLDLIAAARTALPALLDRIDTLEAHIKELERSVRHNPTDRVSSPTTHQHAELTKDTEDT